MRVALLFIILSICHIANAQLPLFTGFDLNSGSGDSYPSSFDTVAGKMVFAANTATNGGELWVSDGSVSGTLMLKDINSGSGNSFPMNYGHAYLNGKLLFNAADATNGNELWETDGTAAGTQLVADIFPGSASSFTTTSWMTAYNGNIYFVASSGGSNGAELWVSDGTTAGTMMLKDIYSGGMGSFPSYMTVCNGKLFFAATTAANGTELWMTDGTFAGTVMVKDIEPGTGSSSPVNFVVSGTSLFFKATTTAGGSELWVSDGTSAGTVMVKDINTGAASGFSGNAITVLNGKVYFNGDDGIAGDELWVSDGTQAGTSMIKDIYPGATGSYPTQLTAQNGKLWFRASDGTNGYEPWVSDGTSGATNMLLDLNPGFNNSLPATFVGYKKYVYFIAESSSIGPQQIFRTDGVGANTIPVSPAGVTGLAPLFNTGSFFNYDSTLFFSAAYDMSAGTELWSLEDTAYRVAPPPPPGNISSISQTGFHVFPNPNSGQFMVQLSNAYIGAHIAISDITGRIVFNKEITSGTTIIDLGSPATGLYLLQIRMDDYTGYSMIRVE